MNQATWKYVEDKYPSGKKIRRTQLLFCSYQIIEQYEHLEDGTFKMWCGKKICTSEGDVRVHLLKKVIAKHKKQLSQMQSLLAIEKLISPSTNPTMGQGRG